MEYVLVYVFVTFIENKVQEKFKQDILNCR